MRVSGDSVSVDRAPAVSDAPASRRLFILGMTAPGALATATLILFALGLVLLLDQVPRNIYRNSPHAFATDGLARLAADDAIDDGHDAATPLPLRPYASGARRTCSAGRAAAG